MLPSARLSELANTIHIRTVEIEEFMSVHNIRQASFNIDSPVTVPLPEPLSSAREEVLDALDQLHALLLGPLPYFMRLTSPAVNILSSLEAISHFNIAKSLGLDEQISYEELAQRCNLNTSDLRRFLRLATANHVFCEPQKNVIAHSAMSRILVETPVFNDWIGLVCKEMWPASTRCIEAMTKWPGSNAPTHTGFSLSNGTDKSFFQEIGRDSERASRFANAMTLIQSAPPLNISFLLDNLHWTDSTCPSSIVDVGGSSGSVSIELLRRFPRIKECVVEDLSDVVVGASVPAELQERLSFKEYDFFTKQSIAEADLYLFRSILHDWPDEQAIQILKNQIPAMKPGARLILNEICLPDPGVLACYQEQFLRGYDLSMKHVFNGKERDADEWASLLAQVDSRLNLRSIRSPPQSMLSIIEVVMEGPDGKLSRPAADVAAGG